MGLAVLATVSTSRSESSGSGRQGHGRGAVGGYHLAFLIAALLVVAAFIVGVTVLEKPAETSTAPEGAGAAEGTGPSESGPEVKTRREPACSDARRASISTRG